MSSNQFEQGTEQWVQMRKSFVGSSDISVIAGTNPYKSRYVLWLEKTGRKEQDAPNAAMNHGKNMEPLAREAYMEDKGIAIADCVFFSNRWDKAMASLDGISIDRKTMIEIKCPITSKLYEMADRNEIPAYYRDQMQWALFVSEAESCDYMVYRDRYEYVIINVKPDLQRQKELLSMAKEFWIFVETDTPPPKNEKDFEVIDTPFDEVLAEQWALAKELADAANKRLEDLEEQIKERFQGKNCIFPKANVKLSWHTRKGTVDWKRVQLTYSIKDEELEEYRKQACEYSKLILID